MLDGCGPALEWHFRRKAGGSHVGTVGITRYLDAGMKAAVVQRHGNAAQQIALIGEGFFSLYHGRMRVIMERGWIIASRDSVLGTTAANCVS